MASSFAIPAAVVTTVGFAEADQLFHKKGFTMKPIIGGFILGVFLFAIAEVDNSLGVLFAALVALNAVIQHGSTVFGRLVKS